MFGLDQKRLNARFALCGSPVAHSLSPLIYQQFAQKLGVSLYYLLLDTPKGKLEDTLAFFRQEGGSGVNVTTPLKGEAYTLCGALKPRARRSGVVNTLGWEGETLWGDCTDGEGLVADLREKRFPLLEARVLILGAGDVVRAVLPAFEEAGVKESVIVNRTLEKAKALEEAFLGARASTYEGLEEKEQPFDLVINATTASREGLCVPLAPQWVKGTPCLDLGYQKQGETLFMRWAREQGAKIVWDGKGMLVAQAALAFQAWYGILPPADLAKEVFSGIHCL